MRRSILAFLVMAIWTPCASAAIVYLKDGSRLEGAVLRRDAAELVLQTAQGPVSIPSDKIQSVEETSAPSPARRRLSNYELFGPQRHTFSLELGLAAPLNSVDFSAIGGGSANNGDVGPLIGLRDLYSLSPRVAVGGEFEYALRPWTYSPGLLPNYNAGVAGETALLLAEFKYSLTDRGRTRPYVLVGIGPGWNTTTIDARPSWGFSWPDTGTFEDRRLVDGSAWGLAGTARLGVDFDLPWSNVFSVESGWTGLTSEHYAATVQGQALGLSGVTAPLNFFTLSARLGWRF